MKLDSKIYVAGHNGMVGSAIVRALKAKGFYNLLVRSRTELDLLRQDSVGQFFQTEKPDYVFLAAAKAGGIHANDTYRADFIYQNLQIQNNIIHSSYQANVKKLLFLGSSCIYPKLCEQPMKEEYLLTKPLEPTNEPYAIAKIAGLKMCESYCRQYGAKFISAMPTNLYGVNDNFHPENSHVIPALMRRIHEAKEQSLSSVQIWGTGSPMREFLYVDDLADACIYLMENYDHPQWINVGSGHETSIYEISTLIAEVIGYSGEILKDPSKPDGTPRKLLDVSRLKALGWEAKIELREGLEKTYLWYLEHQDSIS